VKVKYLKNLEGRSSEGDCGRLSEVDACHQITKGKFQSLIVGARGTRFVASSVKHFRRKMSWNVRNSRTLKSDVPFRV
jgi:hypothetical protein